MSNHTTNTSVQQEEFQTELVKHILVNLQNATSAFHSQLESSEEILTKVNEMDEVAKIILDTFNNPIQTSIKNVELFKGILRKSLHNKYASMFIDYRGSIDAVLMANDETKLKYFVFTNDPNTRSFFLDQAADYVLCPYSEHLSMSMVVIPTELKNDGYYEVTELDLAGDVNSSTEQVSE